MNFGREVAFSDPQHLQLDFSALAVGDAALQAEILSYAFPDMRHCHKSLPDLARTCRLLHASQHVHDASSTTPGPMKLMPQQSHAPHLPAAKVMSRRRANITRASNVSTACKHRVYV